MFKIYKNIVKTGVSDKELKKVFGFSLIGFVILIISFFSSCIKNSISKNEGIKTDEKPTNLKELSNSLKKSTDSIIDSNNKIDDSCGPTPGYPCGTRYYTVSIKDFKFKIL